MIAFYVALALTAAALAAALFLLWPQPAPATAGKSLQYALAAVTLSFLVALLAPEPASAYYKGSILLGLLITLLATVILFSRFLPDYAAHAHLLWVYLIYFTAFSAHTRLQLPVLWVLLIIAAAGVLYWQLSRFLAEVWGAIMAYGLILALAAWQVLELVAQNSAAPWTWAALAGIVLAISAHTLEAIQRYRHPLTHLPVAQVTFLLAQTALAWSVWRTLG
jgi:hypothetical protein